VAACPRGARARLLSEVFERGQFARSFEHISMFADAARRRHPQLPRMIEAALSTRPRDRRRSRTPRPRRRA
jgi:hypothetical protein